MITPHKGGRTTQVNFRLTPAEKADLDRILAERDMSLADWVSEKVRETEGEKTIAVRYDDYGIARCKKHNCKLSLCRDMH